MDVQLIDEIRQKGLYKEAFDKCSDLVKKIFYKQPNDKKSTKFDYCEKNWRTIERLDLEDYSSLFINLLISASKCKKPGTLLFWYPRLMSCFNEFPEDKKTIELLYIVVLFSSIYAHSLQYSMKRLLHSIKNLGEEDKDIWENYANLLARENFISQTDFKLPTPRSILYLPIVHLLSEVAVQFGMYKEAKLIMEVSLKMGDSCDSAFVANVLSLSWSGHDTGFLKLLEDSGKIKENFEPSNSEAYDFNKTLMSPMEKIQESQEILEGDKPLDLLRICKLHLTLETVPDSEEIQKFVSFYKKVSTENFSCFLAAQHNEYLIHRKGKGFEGLDLIDRLSAVCSIGGNIGRPGFVNNSVPERISTQMILNVFLSLKDYPQIEFSDLFRLINDLLKWFKNSPNFLAPKLRTLVSKSAVQKSLPKVVESNALNLISQIPPKHMQSEWIASCMFHLLATQQLKLTNTSLRIATFLMPFLEEIGEKESCAIASTLCHYTSPHAFQFSTDAFKKFPDSSTLEILVGVSCLQDGNPGDLKLTKEDEGKESSADILAIKEGLRILSGDIHPESATKIRREMRLIDVEELAEGAYRLVDNQKTVDKKKRKARTNLEITKHKGVTQGALVAPSKTNKKFSR
eukprot:GHVP01001627.1.p1 GENE.GHVP01001627.1~~GHVP01001627.1.p1  ORF type:complete len:629 (+),score=116.54 GHVP01001627.1:49-1935(+)